MRLEDDDLTIKILTREKRTGENLNKYDSFFNSYWALYIY